MGNNNNISVTVTWGLSHYIPLNGFHPLYRALFDYVPDNIELKALDNFRLYNLFDDNVNICKAVKSVADRIKSKTARLPKNSVSQIYNDFFWPPNQIFTSELMGDIEFHHTAPFPSMKRPFVFHCESFAPIFYPFTHQGLGEFENVDEIREHYRSIFSHPLCLGIFSHIPETLNSIECFFSDSVINSKLFRSKIGLSSKSFQNTKFTAKPFSSEPRFLFINSAHQNSANFFNRGGHLVLRFWEEYIRSGRTGLLILRCAKPSDEDLADYDVDISFINSETGSTIQWVESYLTNHEMNILIEKTHFFLLPSASLHSASIMQAMMSGAIPVVTDTVGTDVYVSDRQNGIVLCGIRDTIWHKDSATGILVDNYNNLSTMDCSLIKQMKDRIFSLLDSPHEYNMLSMNTLNHAQKQFSGEAFSNHFWNKVLDLYKNHKYTTPESSHVNFGIGEKLNNCLLHKEWAEVFGSPTQPMERLYTGRSTVYELGGSLILTAGKQGMNLNDWSSFAQHYNPQAPKILFAKNIDEFGAVLNLFQIKKHRLRVNFIYNILIFFKRYFEYMHYISGNTQKQVKEELVGTEIKGFNVIRCFHKYYAIPKSEGNFSIEKFIRKEYSRQFSSIFFKNIIKKVKKNMKDEVTVCHQPELALEGFHDFNIIKFGDEFHAILQAEGGFDYEKIKSSCYSIAFSDDSISSVKKSIESYSQN